MPDRERHKSDGILRLSLLLRVQDKVVFWLKKVRVVLVWTASRMIAASIPTALFALFAWGVFFSDQGRDLIRSGQDSLTALLKFASALCLMISVFWAALPSFAFTRWPGTTPGPGIFAS